MLDRRVLVFPLLALWAVGAHANTVISVTTSAGLQSAIGTVPDGGVIELATGTYSRAGGFEILNPNKRFTVQAAAGANVVLSGQGTGFILRYLVSVPAFRGAVEFRDLIFRDGFSATDGSAAGVTLNDAEATFVNCTFEDNVCNPANTGGGGVGVFAGSVAYFDGCTFQNNQARNVGAGMSLGSDSFTYVHNSTFTNNRTNLPGHRPSSGGGAISLSNGTLRVSESRFEGNEAGFVGGAIFSIGTWTSVSGDPMADPQADVIVANSTFVDNVAEPAAGIVPPSPTEAGAVHAEDQTYLRIYNSRFFTNDAQTGGAVNTYRSVVEVHGSSFYGNRATGLGASTGFGGAIRAISDDGPEDGSSNFPSARLTVTDSYLQGRFGGVGTTAQAAGCLFASGDIQRNYGLGVISPGGTTAGNRATVVLDNVVMNDCDVQQTTGVGGTGLAGGMSVSLVDLTMTDSLIQNSDALGAVSSAGALRIVFESDASIVRTTFADNSSQTFGGAVLAQGTTVDFDDCQFFGNDTVGTSFGSAMFFGGIENFPSPGQDLAIGGQVRNSTITDNVGLPIYDDDRANGPINDVRYNGNTIYDAAGGNIYTNALSGSFTVSGLNALVVNRPGAANTDKSTVPNIAPGSAPVVGAIHAVPTERLANGATGDPAGPTEARLGYAWTGGSATLDGLTVTGNAGVQTTGVGIHTLLVAGQPFTAQVTSGAIPAASLTATPNSISSGQTANLAWNATGGTFLAAAVDHGVSADASASGGATVDPGETTDYNLCLITAEGGVIETETVFVDEMPVTPIFEDGFESGDTTAWTFAVP